ncbi:MAG: hypothetical protein HY451_01020 [Parcubacteria group bacterium]|nr:hypothetical protein [Parcubacteria group bacterium]
MKKFFLVIIIAIAAVLAGFFWLNKKTEPTTEPTGKENLIRVFSPKPNQSIQSPFIIEGEARGTWYFEASFPIKLIDSQGNQIAVAIAQAQSDWMTEDFVPFRTELEFSVPQETPARLVLKKDNPSGLPEFDDQLSFPVILKPSSKINGKTIKLFYYNSEKDKDAYGNIQCSRDGLEAVERQIPITITPIQDTIRLLLKGELTDKERQKGIATEYPLVGLELEAASLANGTLTLTFKDPRNKTGGGACRAGILWFQIESTAKQFKEVKNVRFLPEELFQP